ncbi:TraR/DksA C4-type zinc finger protein [Alkalibacillus haloalkaliphilus]|uniref:TraR/DksA C4-type zinc finger protein n=1 Tax=Alkalibacillus haloalkaliphilus TaxID=94136 RepID=UPI0003057749|nr:TraR/DksA C4-type zinc finger protein [Alkalibacillus haloalkaliphilus]
MSEQQQWSQLRAEMLEEREQLVDQIEEFEDSPALFEESVGELNSVDDQHPGDSATELYERQKDTTFYYRAKEQLKEIDHALAKMEDGTYGVCEKTGEAIPFERLEAMPTARYKI